MSPAEIGLLGKILASLVVMAFSSMVTAMQMTGRKYD